MHPDPSRMLTTQGNATYWSHLWLQIASDLNYSLQSAILWEADVVKFPPSKYLGCSCKSNRWDRTLFWCFAHDMFIYLWKHESVLWIPHSPPREKQSWVAAFVVHLKNPKKPPAKNQGSSIKMTQTYYNIIEKPENLPVCLTPSPCHCLMLNETQGVIRFDLEGYQDSRSLESIEGRNLKLHIMWPWLASQMGCFSSNSFFPFFDTQVGKKDLKQVDWFSAGNLFFEVWLLKFHWMVNACERDNMELPE